MRRLFSSAWLPVGAIFLCMCIIGMRLSFIDGPPIIDDGLRHLKMAQMMLHAGQPLDWSTFLYAGELRALRVDPWFLSHVLLLPFTSLHPYTAIDSIILLQIACIGLSFLAFLRTQKLSPATSSILCILLLLGNVHFTGRLFLARPFAFMTALMLLSIYACVRERWFLLAILFCIATLLSQLWIFPCFLCGMYCIAKWPVEQASSKNCAIAVLAGITLGIGLHPQSLQYISYMLTVFLRIPFQKSIGLGTEMYSGLHAGEVMTFILFGTIMIFVCHLYAAKKREFSEIGKTPIPFLFVTTSILFGGVFIWARMVDVLWPLQLALIATLLSFDPSASRDILATLFQPQWRKKIFGYIALFCILFSPVYTIWTKLPTDTAERIESAQLTLQNIPSNARVLNLEWDIFPLLLFTRPDVKYARGIDASFDHFALPETTPLLRMFSRKNTDLIQWENWLKQMVNQYGADYLLFDTYRQGWILPAIKKMKGLEKLEHDELMTVFKVQSDF